MFLLVYLVGMGAATVPDKSWEFTRSDGAIISFYATIPLTVDFKVKILKEQIIEQSRTWTRPMMIA